MEEEKLLTDCQYGYRSGRSTSLATIQFTDDIRKEVDQGNLVGAIFIDLSKTFDTISHGALLNKLQANGVQNKELAWFTDYLFGREQYVQLGVNELINQPIFSGVPQGSILGPLLFLVFYNDLVDIGIASRVIKYADDTVVYCSGKDTETIENTLVQDMELIAKYFDENELAFLTTDIFASFGILPLLHLRAYTLQDATVYTCSYLYSGNFIISTVKSRYSHCFNCLKLFNEDRQYPKNGRFWP